MGQYDESSMGRFADPTGVYDAQAGRTRIEEPDALVEGVSKPALALYAHGRMTRDRDTPLCLADVIILRSYQALSLLLVIVVSACGSDRVNFAAMSDREIVEHLIMDYRDMRIAFDRGELAEAGRLAERYNDQVDNQDVVDAINRYQRSVGLGGELALFLRLETGVSPDRLEQNLMSHDQLGELTLAADRLLRQRGY